MSDKKPTRLAVFIDWQNLDDHRSLIDFGRLRAYLDTLGAVRRCFIYVVDFNYEVPEPLQQPTAYLRMIEQCGFVVRYKVIGLHMEESRRTRGNMDVDLTIDAMKMLYDGSITIDKVVIFTGDGDFRSLVKEIRGWRKNNPIKTLVVGVEGHTSRKLRAAADEYLPIRKIMPQICRAEDLVGVAIGGQA